MSPDRRETFRVLHESGCFVMPNPWDLGTARVLAQIGFPAIATTSSGLAWSMGRQDNNVTLDETVRHLHAVAQTVDVPVNADFTNGFAIMPADVANNVAAAVTTGVAGLSIEDSTCDDASPLFEFELAVDRIRAARRAIDESRTGVLLTARSEGFIVGTPGPRGDDSPAHGVRRSGRRLSLRARPPREGRHLGASCARLRRSR